MTSVVTGAFGYIGRYIARRLLEDGERVWTVTTHPDKPNPFGSVVRAYPFQFDRPDELTQSLRGASTLYNTYWIRFEYGKSTYREALRNTATLFDCARKAGVRKIVHISVTHPSADSPLPYYRGKALQEQAVRECGVSYSIVRPTLVFGKEEILANNIAWMMRVLPVFPIFGSGEYRLQPIFVEDVADLAIACARREEPVILDAAGPEVFTFSRFVRLIAEKTGRRVFFLRIPPSLGIAMGRMMSLLLGDVLLTRDELRGLMDELLISDGPPTGKRRFTDWLEENKHTVGAMYTSELGRHYRWRPGKR
jgi:NADH dehydrogenase